MAATAWNPNDKNPRFEIVGTRGGRNPGSGSWYGCRSTTSKTAQGDYERYFEGLIIQSNGSNGGIIGIANSAASLGNYPGSNQNSLGWWGNGGRPLGGSGGSAIGGWNTNDVIGFLMNPVRGTLKARKNLGGFSSAASFTFAPPFFVIGSFEDGPAEFRLNWAAADMINPIPQGAVAWDESDPLYIGAAGRAARYLGARTDAELYLGARSLF